MTRNDIVPRSLTPTELEKLHEEMAEAATWMRAELLRRRLEHEANQAAPEDDNECEQ